MRKSNSPRQSPTTRVRGLSTSELARAFGGSFTDDGVTLSSFNDDPHGAFATGDALGANVVFGNGAQ